MKTDSALKNDIEHELGRDGLLRSNNIHVAVENGAASLYGTAHTEAEKTAAEDATRRAGAVGVIAQSLQIVMPSDCERSDAALVAALRRTLRWNILIPRSIRARVVGGIVTLEGRVRWTFQRKAAVRAARRVAGVSWVYDAILLAPQTEAPTVHDAVKAALARHGTADANSIHVACGDSDGKVMLSGYALSPESVANAEFAAWGVPGVTAVVEDIRSSGDRLSQGAASAVPRLVPANEIRADRPTPATGNESTMKSPDRASDVHRR